MKIQTQFDKKLKEVYHMLALPFPPKTVQSQEYPEEENEVEDTSLDIKPFKPKVKSYNINKDALTTHKATKQLTKFLAELERRRRQREIEAEHDDTNYLQYKENVVNFIESLSSKAKAEKAHRDALKAAKLKEKKTVLLSDIRRFSNALQADKAEIQEQQRRISECHDSAGRRETLQLVADLAPIHEQLTSYFEESNGCVNAVIKQASSSEFESLYSSDSAVLDNKVEKIVTKMKTILTSAEMSAEHDIPSQLEVTVLRGAGQIGRTLKRDNKQFQSNLQNVADNNQKKSSIHTELIVNFAKKAGKEEQQQYEQEWKNQERMSVVLDSMMHRVKGKEVEKQRDEVVKTVRFKLARQDTLEKIKDYGKRKEVLENIDTSYLTEATHDQKSEEAKEKVLTAIANNERKLSIAGKNRAATSFNTPPNQDVNRVATRRSTGPPPPAVTKPTTLRAAGRQVTSPNLITRSAMSSREASPPGATSVSPSGTRKGPAAAAQPGSQVSPRGGVHKPSAGPQSRWK